MKKKIALVYDCIYPFSKGGGEVRFHELGKRLAEGDFEVHLYGMKYWKGEDVIQKEGMYLHGICPLIPIYTKEGRRSIWQAIRFGLSCFVLLNSKFDVIDCCGFPYFSLITCKIVSMIKGKKLYSTWHEVWGGKYWNEYLGKLGIFGFLVEKLSVRLPDEIIAVSKTTGDRIKNELGYKGKITIVPNGIDLDKIKKAKPSKEKSDVIYAGRLMDFKHVDVLIEAISHLVHPSNHLAIKPFNHLKCLIIGEGPEKKKLQELTKRLHLGQNIKFLGFLPHEKIYSYMKSSKVFVLPSTREGFGMVLLEASACGIPFITINIPANAGRDIIDGKIVNGYLSDLNRTKLSKILREIIKRKKVENYRNIAEKYKWAGINSRIEKIYV